MLRSVQSGISHKTRIAHLNKPVSRGATTVLDAASPNGAHTAETIDSLFRLVVARLELAVGTDSTPGIHDSVLNCVSALGELRAAVSREFESQANLTPGVDVAATEHATIGYHAASAPIGEKLLRYRGFHDQLTGLPNGRFFAACLAQALARVEPPFQSLAVICIDVGTLRPLTSAYGDEAINELISTIASRLSASIRAEDMVSRMGNERFLCLLFGLVGREPLAQFAANVSNAISAPVKIDAVNLRLRPSIGIATCAGPGYAARDLLRMAHSATLRSKHEQCAYSFSDDVM